MRASLTFLGFTALVAALVTGCKSGGGGSNSGCTFQRPAAAPAAVEAAPKPKPKPEPRKVNACTKANSPFWNSLKPYKGSWRTDGRGFFYQWDGLHNDVEKWERRGGRLRHIGSADPRNGDVYKGPKHPPQPMP